MRVKHHRKCRSNGGSNAQSNIAYVGENEHRAWHLLFFKNYTAHKIAEIINEHWIDPQFEVVVAIRGEKNKQ
jgi:hypothetical protein